MKNVDCKADPIRVFSSRMKKLLIVIFLLAASIASRAEIYLGARYGAGLSMTYFTPSLDENAIFTPVNAAVAFRYCRDNADDYERYMNLLVEFGYGERGYALGDSAPTQVRSQVLEVPVMMQARIPVVKHVNVLITGIVYGAYYLNNKRTEETPAGKVTESFSYNNLGGFEYGVGGGLGLCLNFGKTDFAVDARYMASMSYLIKPTVDLYESMPMQVIVSFSIMRKIGK